MKQSKRDLLAFDRSDRIGLLVTIWVAVGLAFVALAYQPVARWVRGAAVEVPFTSRVTVPELDRVGTTYGAAEYAVRIAHPRAVDYALTLLPGLLALALFVAGALVVQRIARTIGSGDPFAARQVRRLRLLAGLLLVGAPAYALVNLASTGALLSRAELGGLDPALIFPFPLAAMAAGLVLALLAEAFKTGTDLRDDVEGLV